jgi:hypothetical protein
MTAGRKGEKRGPGLTIDQRDSNKHANLAGKSCRKCGND